MNSNSRFIPIEDILNVNDTSIVWYYIPGFNGYEISNTNILRSMKHHRKYPYGLLITPDSKCNYELSDNNNKRVKVNISILIDLAVNNPYKNSSGYPRPTYIVDHQSRNPRELIRKEKPKFDQTPQYAKFTIIKTDS